MKNDLFIHSPLFIRCFQNIVEVLRKHILDFTVNLHEGEELKKSLKTDRDRYRESRNKYRHEVEMERSEVATLKMQEHELNAQVKRIIFSRLE